MFGWADYTITLAEMIAITWYALTTVAAQYGFGRPVTHVSEQHQAFTRRMLFLTNLLWIWASNLVRISTGLLLLQLDKDTRWWKRVLWTVIVAQIVCMIGATTVQLSVCRPIRYLLGDKVPGRKCMPRIGIVLYGYTYNVYNVLCDMLFSLMPVALIWQLHRPMSEKILICCLMATWLVASSTVIVKMATVMYSQVHTDDPDYQMLKINLYCGLEMLLGTLAACLPCLKGSVQRLLHHLGIVRSRNDPTASPDSPGNFENSSHIVRQLREIGLQTLDKSFSRSTPKSLAPAHQDDTKKEPSKTAVTTEAELSNGGAIDGAQEPRSMV